MGIGSDLVNYTKRERVMFTHIDAKTAGELARHPTATAITTWYMLANLGDHIAFVTDSYDDWPFPEGSKADLTAYREVTNEVVDRMIEEDILVEEGRMMVFDDEPDLYFRLLCPQHLPPWMSQMIRKKTGDGH